MPLPISTSVKIAILLKFGRQVSKSLEMLNVLALVTLLTPNIHRQVIETQIENKRMVLEVLTDPVLTGDPQLERYTQHLESTNRLLDRKLQALLNFAESRAQANQKN